MVGARQVATISQIAPPEPPHLPRPLVRIAKHLVIAAKGRGGWMGCCAEIRILVANRLAPTNDVR